LILVVKAHRDGAGRLTGVRMDRGGVGVGQVRSPEGGGAGAWEGQGIEASVRVPLGTDVRSVDKVKVLNVAAAGGTWDVVTVRPNSDHVRVMLKQSSR
jgi:hypothetical protein